MQQDRAVRGNKKPDPSFDESGFRTEKQGFEPWRRY